MPDLNSLRKLYLDRQPIKQATFSTAGIIPLISDPSISEFELAQQKANETYVIVILRMRMKEIWS